MSTPYIVRTDGPYGPATNFSMTRPVLLVNSSGYALSNPAIQVVNTNNGTDFSMLYKIVLVNTSGVAPI